MPLSESQEAIGISHRSRGEAEITPFPAPYHDADKTEAAYEIPESLRKMFPSESALEVEAAHPAPAPQIETFSETQQRSANSHVGAEVFPGSTSGNAA